MIFLALNILAFFFLCFVGYVTLALLWVIIQAPFRFVWWIIKGCP